MIKFGPRPRPRPRRRPGAIQPTTPGFTFTPLDSSTYYALIGAMRRCYAAIGLDRPAPKFAELLKQPKAEAAD